MFMRANFVDIYSQGMRDRSMRSRTELAQEIKLTDWSMAGNLSNRYSGVQLPCDICTHRKRYLYSAKCSWIIRLLIWLATIILNSKMKALFCCSLPRVPKMQSVCFAMLKQTDQNRLNSGSALCNTYCREHL